MFTTQECIPDQVKGYNRKRTDISETLKEYVHSWAWRSMHTGHVGEKALVKLAEHL